MVWIVLAVLGWACAGYWAFRYHADTTMRVVHSPALPPGTGEFRVVAVCSSGARARQMYERGAVGPNETLSLYHGPECRGTKRGDG